MGLSEDQRALLQLLADGHDYGRIAGVLGTDPDDVRRRAHAAAAAAEADPGERELAERIGARLRELEGGEAPSSPSAGAQPGSAGTRWLWPAILAGAVLLVAVVIFVAAGGEDGDPVEQAPSGPDVEEEVVTIELDPVGGGGARGRAKIVRIGDQPAVDLATEGLEPSGAGESYVLALTDESGKTLPIAFRAVGESGSFSGRTIIPTAALGLLPSLDFLVVSLAREQEAAEAVRDAASSGSLPADLGTAVLRGRLPG